MEIRLLKESFQAKVSILEHEIWNFYDYLRKPGANVCEIKVRMKAAEKTWEEYRTHILDGTRLPGIYGTNRLPQDFIDNANKYFETMGIAEAIMENLNGPKPQSNTDTA